VKSGDMVKWIVRICEFEEEKISLISIKGKAKNL